MSMKVPVSLERLKPRGVSFVFSDGTEVVIPARSKLLTFRWDEKKGDVGFYLDGVSCAEIDADTSKMPKRVRRYIQK